MPETRKSLTINIVCGNLLNLEAPAYVLGVFEEIAPKAALRSVDRLLGGEVMARYRANQIDGRLGAVTHQPTASDRLRADSLVLVGMGPIDDSDARSLKRLGRPIVEQFGELGETVVTTIPLGLGSGHSVQNVVTYYIGDLIEAIARAAPTAPVTVLNICDFDEANCAALKVEIEKLGRVGVLAEFAFQIDEKAIAKELQVDGLADDPLPPEATYLQIRMGELVDPQATSVDVETTLILPGGGASVDHRIRTIQTSDLRALLADIHGDADIDYDLGCRLSKMLLHEQTIGDIVSAQHREEHPVILLHDRGASIVPWEVMSFSELQFPATCLSLSRRFMATNMAARPVTPPLGEDALRVLLVVDPTEDLSGARREGDRVAALLDQNTAAHVEPLFTSDATRKRLLMELERGRYDVIHYAGHAFFDPAHPGRSGLICHKGEVLTGEDAAKFDAFPRLVFFNACESGRIRRGRAGRDTVEATPIRRVERSVGVAEAFIRGGVQHFIGTFWPVGDRAAEAFATEFYKRLIDGQTIGAAIMRGRQEVFRSSSSDWADYIHYGDPSNSFKIAP